MVSGEVDMSTAARLAEALGQFANGSVVVDLTDVTFLDSSGVAALLAARKRLERRGVELSVESASPAALHILQLVGVTLDLQVPTRGVQY